MPDFKVDIKLHKKGPLFQNPSAKIKQFMFDAKRGVANTGKEMIRARLGQVLKHPTGIYESRIAVEIASDDVSLTDRGIVYGPWLEGTGSRNQTTRFKGYKTFRITKQELNKKMPELLRPYIQKLIRELGG